MPPPVGGAGPYALGAVALAVAIGVLLYVKCSGDPKPPQEPVATAPPTATQTVELPEYSPPPPPPEEDAGVDGGVTPASVPKGGGPVPAGACSACGKGVPSPGLASAVHSTAGLARGCYNRALRSGGGEGVLAVSVSVGPDGALCSASVTNDTLQNPGVAACVLSKFRSRSYPAPKQGCVVVNVPINFKMKK